MQTWMDLQWASGRLRGAGFRAPRGLAPVHGGPATGAGRAVAASRWARHIAGDEGLIEGILRDAAVCKLAPSEERSVGAMCLGYGHQDELLFCHAEPDGWQVSVIRQHPEVRFVIEPEKGAAAVPVPGAWPAQRVVGTGWAGVVEDADGKREGLDLIMAHYGRPGPLVYPDEVLRRNAVIRVAVRQWRVEHLPRGAVTGLDGPAGDTGWRPADRRAG